MTQVSTTHQRPQCSLTDMRRFLEIGWGDLGLRVAAQWQAYNERHFASGLQPIPILLVSTSPYGHWLGCTYCAHLQRRAHLIQLTYPAQGKVLIADKGVLLHEMIHQKLAEDGQTPKHEAQPWCDEIMRIHHELTGKRIWATPETVGKLPLDKATGKRKSIRQQMQDPATGKPSLDRMEIATWPHSVGIRLGRL